ncbi:MFS transporter [Streptomyces sp. 184]|uniref:MFS transporter n=1 Tax=Streptomyces sp. 184 TaxID=1827526 RepID=UPI0038926E44
MTSNRVILAGTATIAVTFGLARYGYGLFEPELRREFGLSMAQMGLIGSAGYVGYLLALLLVGALVARVGPRPLVVAGGAAATAGMALVAVARGPVALTAGLVLAGTSSGWAWAPYSDAVDRLVPRSRRARALGVIDAGTAFGVTVAGPLALLAYGTGWRPVWLLFAAVALATTVYSARVLPRGAHRPVAARGAVGALGPRWFARRKALPLYATAAAYGFVGAGYWTYAVAAVEDGGAFGSGDAGRVTTALFWTLIGVAGTAAALTGHAVGRFGLRRVHTAMFGGLAVAVALLGLAPGAAPAVVASAALYGPLAVSALPAVWSYRVFPEAPATGFSATLAFLALGTIAAPAVLGALADARGLRAAFLATALVALVATAARPEREPGRTAGRTDGVAVRTNRALGRTDRAVRRADRASAPTDTSPSLRASRTR